MANSVLKSPTDFEIAPDLMLSRAEILQDFEHCCVSREASLLGRKEVLTGKAKFGIFGDGKEVPQIAMAKAFRKGDFRSGYYRDQTFAFALGISTIEQFFAQIYSDSVNDPFSSGRQMNSHFATPFTDKDGNWISQLEQYNTASDISPTAAQMARGLGLALASKKYRESDALREGTLFSDHGNEVCFTTIGDASTSEGVFWETMNAAGVLKVPLAVSVWDDGYGISVPVELQTVKASISEALEGFRVNKQGQGIDIYTVKGWDYPGLVKMYRKGIDKVRRTHIAALFHIEEVTQPQGHSTSGSHERYKSKERLDWEREHDCLVQMERWILDNGIATPEECEAIHQKAKKYARDARDRAWKAFNTPTQVKLRELKAIYTALLKDAPALSPLQEELEQLINPSNSEVLQNARRASYLTLGLNVPARAELSQWIDMVQMTGKQHYGTRLYSDSPYAALQVPEIKPVYSETSPTKNGFEILNAFFDATFEKYPNVYAFGEDLGNIGDVNQGFAGLQKKYGESRIFDTSIREWTIMGQAIGMAMRGLRPIAEIQYLDYLLYGLEPLSDDLATLRYRTNGIQHAPVIVRTRGHRLEGIWHAGSPMGMILGSLRGLCILTPRNMVQAVGFYNTMLQSDDPAIVIECLNGYRLKEKLPDNIDTYTLPLGIPEVLEEGTDVTLVTYGSCIRVAQEGMKLLKVHGISVELIDVQTLMPFDIHHRIVASLKKTNRVLFMDEDLPGGATAYLMQEVLEKQGGYQYLDSAPVTLTAAAHRPPYGSDGDYFSKPSPEDVFETVYKMMYEVEPKRFSPIS